MFNPEWHSNGFRAMVNFLPFCTMSDHIPVLVSFVESYSLKPKPFRYLKMWQKHPDFQDLLRENWQTPHLGTKQFILCMKLKDLKVPLKALNNNTYSHIL